MNMKNFLKIIIAVIIIILLGLVSYFVVVPRTETSFVDQTLTLSPVLTEEIALSLLKENAFLMECNSEGIPYEYRSCSVDILKEKDQWIVTVTHDGLFDDSIAATRMRIIVKYENGQWVKGEISQTQRCWPGRGHQDFSTEFCI